MANMAKQMELFDEGGLMQEGGTVDPVSGNDVPVGSTQEEVRDDIPAQLSEGEFVMPADVVRYHGLDKMMALRDEAKMGLQRMEAMGQMGNADEATIPDGVPFGMEDLEMEDDGEPQEFQLGGVVQAPGTGISGYKAPNIPTTGVSPNPGNDPTGMPPPVFTFPQPIPFQPQPTQAASQQQQMLPNINVQPGIPYYPGFTPLPPGFQPPPMNLPPTDPATGQLKLPTFYDMVGQPGAAGEQQPKPDPTDPVKAPTAPTVSSDDGGGDNQDDTPTTQGELNFGDLGKLGGEVKRGFTNLIDPIRELFGLESKLGDRKDAEAMEGLGSTPGSYLIGDIFESANKKTDAFGGSEKFGLSNPELRSATLKQAGAQLATLGVTNPLTAIMKDFGIIDFKVSDIGRAGFAGMNSALASLGMTNRGQLFNNEQAKLVGTAMAAAHAATLKGLSPTEVQAAYNKVLNTDEAKKIQRNSYNVIKSSVAENMGRNSLTDLEFSRAMTSRVQRADAILTNLNSPTGTNEQYKASVVRDRTGKAVTSIDPKTKQKINVLTAQGKALKNKSLNEKRQASVLLEQAMKVAEAKKAERIEKVKSMEAKDKTKDYSVPLSYDDYTGPDADFDRGDIDFGTSFDDDDDIDEMGDGDESFSGGFADDTDDDDDDYDGDEMNKGGLAKQMKRSGLASKK
tara:strand:- start:53 stop:2092 length:2040 start_codon:yes stop_codon:yes gene_type:complete